MAQQQYTPLETLQRLALQGGISFNAGGQAISRGTSFGLLGNDGDKLAQYYQKTYPNLNLDTSALTSKDNTVANALEFLSSIALMGPVVGAGEAAAGKALASQPVQQALQKLPQIAQNYLPEVLKGAAGFAGYEALNKPLHRLGSGGSPLDALRELPRALGEGALIGGAFGAVAPAFKQLFGKASPAVKTLPKPPQGNGGALGGIKQPYGLKPITPKPMSQRQALQNEQNALSSLLQDAGQLGQLDSIPAYDYLTGFGINVRPSKTRFDQMGRPLYKANIPGQKSVYFPQNAPASKVANARGVSAFIQKNGGLNSLDEAVANINEAGATADQVAALDAIANAKLAAEKPKLDAFEQAQEDVYRAIQNETKAIKMAPTQAAADAAMENIGNATINPMVVNPAQVAAAERAYVNSTERLYRTGDGAPIKGSKFVETAKAAPITVPSVADEIAAAYTPITNTETLAKAQALNATNPEAATALMREEILSADGVAVAMDRVRSLQNEGRVTEAVELLEMMAGKASKAGQAIQALSMYSRLTPEGALRQAVRVADEAGTVVSEDLAKQIGDLAKRIEDLPDGNEKIELTRELLGLIAKAAPPSMWQKLTTLQTMGQLLNPKTIIRNLIGNAGFAAVEASKDVLATGVDAALSVFTKTRTKTLPSPAVAVRGFYRGLRQGVRDAAKGLPDTTAATKFELPKTPSFNDPIFGNLEKLLGITLRGADKAFYQMAYDSSLATQMKLANVAAPTPEMVAKAHVDGLYATFQDSTVLSEVFTNTKRALNAISPESIEKMAQGKSVMDNKFGAGEFLLKYPKTPANLLARAIDYGPIGILKGGYQALRPAFGKPFNQAQFVDDFTRGVIGTGAGIGTGYHLGKLGILTAESDPDKDVNALKRVYDQGPNRLNVSALNRYWMSGFNQEQAKAKADDLIISYDWAQPIAIPLQAGVNMAKAEGGPNEEMAVNYAARIAEAVAQGADTLTEQGMLQGVREIMNARDEEGKPSPAKGIINVAAGAPASFAPSVLNQIGQLGDNTVRETYSPDITEQAINKIKAKIPGLAQTLPEKVDTLGVDLERYQGGSNNPFNVFINPAFVSRLKNDPVANEVLAIYENSGETQQAPRVVPKSLTVNGEKIKLTGKELGIYQRFVGKRTKILYETLLNDPYFSMLDDSGRADVMASALTSINSAAKVQLFGQPVTKRTDKLTQAIVANRPDIAAALLTRKAAKRLTGMGENPYE